MIEKLMTLFEMDFSLTVTAIIALSALFSPIIVAIINNVHHTKIRKLELKNEMEQKQFDVYYADKFKAFTNLTTSAGKLVTGIGEGKSYTDIYVHFHNALLLCNDDNKFYINDLVETVNKQLMSGEKPDLKWEAEYIAKLSELSTSLNKELMSTADSIKRLYRTKGK